MTAIINIGNLSAASPPIAPVQTPAPVASVPGAVQPQGADTVEFSAFGQALSQATELSSLSVARVRAIRSEIAKGTFETPERLAGTAARLAEIIGQPPTSTRHSR